MSVSIKNVRPATNDEWDSMCRACDYSTFFHSRDWSEIWSTQSNGKLQPQPVIIEFSDGKKALIPFSIKRRVTNLLSQYHTGPNYSYGGWVSGDELEAAHSGLLKDWILQNKTIPYLSWRFNPYDPFLKDTQYKEEKENLTERITDLKEFHQNYTDAVDLRTDFDSILKNWSRGHKGSVNKALKEGIQIETDNTLESWMEYFEIFQSVIKRWENGAAYFAAEYNKEFFQLLFEKKSPDIRLWVARYQGKLIAGAICFYSKRHVIEWHLAASSDHLNLRSTHLLKYEVIKHAQAQGLWWYDFMDSGGCSEGVRLFKQGFGTTELQCPWLWRQNAIQSSLQSVKKLLRPS